MGEPVLPNASPRSLAAQAEQARSRPFESVSPRPPAPRKRDLREDLHFETAAIPNQGLLPHKEEAVLRLDSRKPTSIQRNHMSPWQVFVANIRPEHAAAVPVIPPTLLIYRQGDLHRWMVDPTAIPARACFVRLVHRAPLPGDLRLLEFDLQKRQRFDPSPLMNRLGSVSF